MLAATLSKLTSDIKKESQIHQQKANLLNFVARKITDNLLDLLKEGLKKHY